MSNLILHIGLHKTATTYIQQYFLPRLKGVIYYHGSLHIKEWNNQVNEKSKHLLISNESFSGKPWNDKWKRGEANDHSWIDSYNLNIKKLKLFFPDAIIVVSFRKHGDLLLSLYNLYVQAGGVLPIEDFYGAGKVIESRDLNFRNRIDFLKDCFSRVYLLNFEAFKVEGESYLKRFFGEEFSIETGSKISREKKANQSVKGWKLETLRKMNKYYKQFPQSFKRVLRNTAWSPRKIMQNRLSFIKEEERSRKKLLKQKVNEEFQSDWNYFLRNQWKA